jgi:hypothetical protein
MRMPYLRQLTQPLTAGVSALKPSRRWPMRADEQRVPAQASPLPPANEPIERAAAAAPRAREARQPDARETGTPPSPAPGPWPPLRLQTPAIRGLASPDLVTAPPRAPPDGPAPPGAPSPPPSSHVPVTRPAVVAEASAHHEAAAGHSAHGILAHAKPTPRRDADAPRPPESPRPKPTDAEPPRRAKPIPHASADASSPPESPHLKPAEPEPSRPVDAPSRPEPLRSIAPPAAAMLSSSVAAEPRASERLRFDRADAPSRSGAAAGPSLKIGTIEVRVAAAPPAPGPPPAPAPPHGPRSPAAAPSRPTALSRGFASPFGLRQA